jgi:hypothetical protein
MSTTRYHAVFVSALTDLFVLLRCFAILRPMSNVVNVARRGNRMLAVAWALATFCSIPQVSYQPMKIYSIGGIIRCWTNF